MREPFDLTSAARAMTSLDDIDTEIARLALLCQVQLLDPGVIDRVVRNDASVCGTNNPVAFAKLHGMVALHFGVRDSMADAHGQALTSCVEKQVIDRLQARFPTLAGQWPPAGR
ncbi:MAG: hypothetical protein K0R70_783 [Steroidobacteraceae bacterium]|jgi:hypothetical protein|nr:hypothetical protein [Steroidobacteraceae bacterium]